VGYLGVRMILKGVILVTGWY